MFLIIVLIELFHYQVSKQKQCLEIKQVIGKTIKYDTNFKIQHSSFSYGFIYNYSTKHRK